MFGCGVKSERVGFFHASHFSIYLVNALVFNGKAVVERRGFRPKFSMNYPIPTTPEEIAALRQRPVDEEMIAAVIAGIIRMARAQGQSLDDLTEEILAEDPILDQVQRRWLSQLLTNAWQNLAGWV